MKPDNPYQAWVGEDLALSKMLLTKDELQAIPAEVRFHALQMEGDGPKPKVVIDLEQMQVVDYAAFEGLTDWQRRQIKDLHAGNPVRPDEMVFLALKSMVQFIWPETKGPPDVRFAACSHAALNAVLARRAAEVSRTFAQPEGLMPYWGRLTFLRVMGDLPLDNVKRFGLDRVACALVKKNKFNAMTVTGPDGSLICLNYALEPILKQLNAILLHFFGTKELAGPKRMARAWNALLPMVLHFWSDVAAPDLMREPVFLYEEQTGFLGHDLTMDQLDFIVMHELGHVAFDHPRRLKAQIEQQHVVTEIRHEFEFAADAFALGLMRSQLNNRAKATLQGDPRPAPDVVVDAMTGSLHGLQRRLGSVFLLFTFMDFIQRAGELLRDRNDGRLTISDRMDTHPRAADRLERLERTTLGEYLYTSPIQRYAAGLLQDVLDHAADLDQAELIGQAAAFAR